MLKPKPIPLQAPAFRVIDARRAGVSRGRLRAKDIRRAGRGILLHPESALDPDSYLDRCRAIGLTLGPGCFVSRRSAALLYGIPCPRPPDNRIEVASFTSARAPRRCDVFGHRVRQRMQAWCELDGIVLPSAADVWCQLAAVLSFPDLVAAGDFLLSGARIVSSGGLRRDPLTTRQDLASAHALHRASTGSPLRAQALPLLRCPVDSPPETKLRLTIVQAGFAEPVVNCPVPVAGRLLHADLGYPELRIAIEYEGAHHFSDPQQLRYDAVRREQMYAAGWRVLRVVAEDLASPREFLNRLAAAIHG